MRRGVSVLTLLVLGMCCPGLALAAPEVSLDPAPDGTLTVVGNGWRPGQRLVVSLGPCSFPAMADSTGSFEVPTGLASFHGPVAVHRQRVGTLAMVRLGPPDEPGRPNPLAVLFVQDVLSGIAVSLLVGSAAALAVAVSRRMWQR